MPAIFERSTDKLIQVIPNYPASLEMAGKYVVDYPDYFSLDIDELSVTPGDEATIKAAILSAKDSLYETSFATYDNILTNNLMGLSDIAPSAPLSFDSAALFPWAATGEFLSQGIKTSDTANGFAVMGRYPSVNHIGGGVVTNDDTLTGAKCVITKEIDITAYTSDGLGRSEFMVYFRSALKSYVKDISYLEGVNSSQRGGLFYTQSDKSSPNGLRLFISADNGLSYQEMDSLSSFVFPVRKDAIRLAFVNFTNADIHLLSFTLMF